MVAGLSKGETGSDPLFGSIAILGELVRDGQLSSAELVEAALRRICDLNSRLHAFITVITDDALGEARAADLEIRRGGWRGPLHGLPFAVKDNYFTRGVLTTLASRTFADFVPSQDAAVVSRLRAAGAILVGKTNMVPFGWGPSDTYYPEYGVTRNPWGVDRFSGGSSNGSAIGVATGMVALGMGADGGGSIRTPASFCGISGLKPTAGLVSRYGVWLNSPSVETLGPLARSAEDCAIALQVLAGYDYRDPASSSSGIPDYRAGLTRDIRGVRIGIQRSYFFEDLQPAVDQAVAQSVSALKDLGATIHEVEIPGLLDDVRHFRVLHAEAAFAHRSYLEERPHDYPADTFANLVRGRELGLDEYLVGVQAFRSLRVKLEEMFREVDILLTPTRDTVAPHMADNGRILDVFPYERAGRPSHTAPFNLGGQPAISIPCGFDPDGLPIGLQLVGRLFDDATVLRVADAYQQVTEWHRAHPSAIGEPMPTIAGGIEGRSGGSDVC